MKTICIYGAGGAGCTLGAALFKAGIDVTMIARGAHLAALRERGLRFITGHGEETLRIPCTDDPAAAGPRDVVVIAAKAYSIARDIAPRIAALCHENTIVIPACNGIPWWFTHSLKGPLENRPLRCLYPEMIEPHIPFKRVIGGLFYMGATLEAPGVVSNYGGIKFPAGEPDGTLSSRVQALGALLEKAGLKNPVTAQIRSEILRKLCWNIAFNPLAVITGKAGGPMASDPLIIARVRNIVAEMEMLAAAFSIPLQIDMDRLIVVSMKAPDQKPSMLQDYENGKPLETDAILNAVIEMAAALGLDIPHIRQTTAELQKKIEERGNR